MSLMKWLCAIVWVSMLGACTATELPPLNRSATSTSTQVDTLLINGQVLTLADSSTTTDPTPTSVAVSGERIVAVGGAELAQQYAAKQTIDLAGATLLPGFNDTHIHIEGNARRYIDLTEVTSIAQMQTLVAQRAKQLGREEWITGYGWSEDELMEKRKPTRADFDTAAPQNPVVLTRAGAHSAVANSLALQLAGFTNNSPDPQNGSLERNAEGELTLSLIHI